MSMHAAFVQVDSFLLERIRRDPDVARELFPAGLDLASGSVADPDALRTAIVDRGPELLAGVMDMHPELRELIEQRVGVTQEELRQGAGGEGLFELMQQRLGSTPATGGQDGPPAISLDKAWHGVHYLLTGSVGLEATADPAGQAVLGGTEIGEDFLGYGPVRLLEPELVADIAVELADPVIRQAAENRFDQERMTELQVYPFGWDDGDREWLLSSLGELARFYGEASERGCAVAACLE